jgi:hypothetical protein
MIDTTTRLAERFGIGWPSCHASEPASGDEGAPGRTGEGEGFLFPKGDSRRAAGRTTFG